MVTYPKDWKECRLNDLLAEKPQNGLTKPKAVRGNGVKMVGMGELFAQPHITNVDMARVPVAKSEMKNYELKMNDLLFARQSLVLEGAGKCSIIADIKEPTVFESHLIRARIDEDKADANFIFYWFNHTQGRNAILSLISRVAAAGVRSSELVKIRIILPSSVYEQKAIAATLSSFDTHIDNLTALIEKKKAIRDGALADLMSGRTRLAGFSGEWEETTLGKKIDVLRGKRLVRSQLSISSSGKFPVYQNSLLPLGYHEEFNCLPESVFVIAAGNAGDIGYSKTAFWAADDCYYFEHDDNIDQKFLCYNFLNRQAEIYTQTRRTSIPRLSRDILEKIKMRVPPLAEQKSIADLLTSIDAEIQNIEAERDKMQAIRAGAMDDLLTGRVRLPM